jgi:hypothetical protein
LFGSLWSVAQTTTFSIRIEEDSITGMPGLQSFVRGTYLGDRRSHGRPPSSAALGFVRPGR